MNAASYTEEQLISRLRRTWATLSPSSPTSAVFGKRLLLAVAILGASVLLVLAVPAALDAIREPGVPRGKRSAEDYARGYLLSVGAALRVYEAKGLPCTSLTQLIDASSVSTFTLGYDVRIVADAGLRAVAVPSRGEGRTLALRQDGVVVVVTKSSSDRPSRP